MSMRPQDPRRPAAIGRTPRPVVTRITSRRTPGTVTVVTCLPSMTPRTGVANPIAQGKDWIVTNLVASLRRAARKGVGTMTRQPKELRAPLGDGDLTPLQDGAPLAVLGFKEFCIYVQKISLKLLWLTTG